MKRSSSVPLLPITHRSSNPVSTSILQLAVESSFQDLGPESTSSDSPDFPSTPWSPLVRWVENPLRADALAVYTVSANAGLTPAEWRGVPFSVLRRSGEWHNLVSHPNLRPTVTYIKQFISEVEIKNSEVGHARARGVEWFLLAQLVARTATPFTRGIQFVLAAPSQIGLSVRPTSPCFRDEHYLRDVGIQVTPTEILFQHEYVPLEGKPWGISAVAIWVPMFEVSHLETIMQILTVDDPSLGSNSALNSLSARRKTDSYVQMVRRGVQVGMAISLQTVHSEDLKSLLINEAVSRLDLNSSSWFSGIDNSILHFCRDELLAWLEENMEWKEHSSARSLTELLRLGQSKYLKTLEDTFQTADIVEGLGVAAFETKIRMCVSHSFSRLVRRLKRKDPRDSLIKVLRDKEPSCRAEVLGIVKIEDEVYEHQKSGKQPEYSSVTTSNLSKKNLRPSSDLPATKWMLPSPDEVVRSEPISRQYDVNPDPHVSVSILDKSPLKMLSSRNDKLVWLVARDGGYWRCLLPWILLAEDTYKIESGDSSGAIRVHDVTAHDRPPVSVRTFQELHEDISNRLKEDLLFVSRLSQTMPDSWRDPEVRASLIFLIAGSRGLICGKAFSPCVRRLVSIINEVVYKTRQGSDARQPQTGNGHYSKQVSRDLISRGPEDESVYCLSALYLPSEVHCCDRKSPPDSQKNGWFGIRWHEETLLVAPGCRYENKLHAEGTYVLANSNTHGLITLSATGCCDKESWIVGTLTIETVFNKTINMPPRMGTPHIQLGAYTLEMFWMAAERALGVQIGVLWAGDEGVLPAVVLKGPMQLLEQFASWVPTVRILGTGYSAPPTLMNRTDKQYFSRGKLAARVWTQDQMRMILAIKQDRLEQELGLGARKDNTRKSTYGAHSIADCVLLFLHVKFALPVTTNMDGGWMLHEQVNTAGQKVGVRMHQRLLLHEDTAVRAAGNKTLEIAVDGENKLVLRGCEVKEICHPNNGLREYILHAAGRSTYERIATGTVEDCAFFNSGKRVSCGTSLANEDECEKPSEGSSHFLPRALAPSPPGDNV